MLSPDGIIGSIGPGRMTPAIAEHHFAAGFPGLVWSDEAAHPAPSGTQPAAGTAMVARHDQRPAPSRPQARAAGQTFIEINGARRAGPAATRIAAAPARSRFNP